MSVAFSLYSFNQCPNSHHHPFSTLRNRGQFSFPFFFFPFFTGLLFYYSRGSPYTDREISVPINLHASQNPSQDENDSDNEEFVYRSEVSNLQHSTHLSFFHQVHPSQAQLESLYAAASSGDLHLLQRLFKNALENGNVEPFSLANEASSRTGFTTLHAAASKGYYNMVVWCKQSFPSYSPHSFQSVKQ